MENPLKTGKEPKKKVKRFWWYGITQKGNQRRQGHDKKNPKSKANPLVFHHPNGVTPDRTRPIKNPKENDVRVRHRKHQRFPHPKREGEKNPPRNRTRERIYWANRGRKEPRKAPSQRQRDIWERLREAIVRLLIPLNIVTPSQAISGHRKIRVEKGKIAVTFRTETGEKVRVYIVGELVRIIRNQLSRVMHTCAIPQSQTNPATKEEVRKEFKRLGIAMDMTRYRADFLGEDGKVSSIPKVTVLVCRYIWKYVSFERKRLNKITRRPWTTGETELKGLLKQGADSILESLLALEHETSSDKPSGLRYLRFEKNSCRSVYFLSMCIEDSFKTKASTTTLTANPVSDHLATPPSPVQDPTTMDSLDQNTTPAQRTTSTDRHSAPTPEVNAVYHETIEEVLPIVRVLVNKRPVYALLDTGAGVSYIRISQVTEDEIQPTGADGAIAVNGSPIHFLGESSLKIRVGNITITHQFLVSEDLHCPAHMLLGADFMRKLNHTTNKTIHFDFSTRIAVIGDLVVPLCRREDYESTRFVIETEQARKEAAESKVRKELIGSGEEREKKWKTEIAEKEKVINDQLIALFVMKGDKESLQKKNESLKSEKADWIFSTIEREKKSQQMAERIGTELRRALDHQQQTAAEVSRLHKQIKSGDDAMNALRKKHEDACRDYQTQLEQLQKKHQDACHDYLSQIDQLQKNNAKIDREHQRTQRKVMKSITNRNAEHQWKSELHNSSTTNTPPERRNRLLDLINKQQGTPPSPSG